MDRVSFKPPVVVKLGGSLITHKNSKYTYREGAVEGVARAIADSRVPVVLVHGGGSFGHAAADEYHLSSRTSAASPRGVSETRDAMFRLDAMVRASLLSEGVHPYAFSPFSLVVGGRERCRRFIGGLLAGGVTPVAFGDVVHDGKGFTILSGDEICKDLSKMLGSRACVMAMDVDGVLDRDHRTIQVLGRENLGEVAAPPASSDATGGIMGKVRTSLEIAASGTEVRLVSGLRPEEFAKALRGVEFRGTRVKVPRRGSHG